MNQTLHVFRKDLRHLWPTAVILLLLIAVHAVFDVRSFLVQDSTAIRANSVENMLITLLPLAISFLIASVVFQEPLPGDRQFWLTRPYRWPQLAAAKCLFLFFFVNAPLFFSDCYVLWAQGFPVIRVLDHIFLRQLFMSVLFILPSFAIATLTTGLAQFLLGWFIIVLALICESGLVSIVSGSNISFGFEFGWIFVAVVIVVTCGIILWQYATRRALAARLLLVAFTVGFAPLAWGISYLTAGFRAGSKTPPAPNQSNVRISYDLDRGPGFGNSRTGPPMGFVRARLPLHVVGLKPDTLLRGSGQITITIHGTQWPKPGDFVVGPVQKFADRYWQDLDFETSRIPILKQQPVNLHSVLDLETVNDRVETVEPVTAHSFFVPNVGLCRLSLNAAVPELACRAGLEPSIETDIAADPPALPRRSLGVLSPHSVPWGLSPTSELGWFRFPAVAGTELSFIPRRKFRELHLELDVHNLQLANYISQ